MQISQIIFVTILYSDSYWNFLTNRNTIIINKRVYSFSIETLVDSNTTENKIV